MRLRFMGDRIQRYEHESVCASFFSPRSDRVAFEKFVLCCVFLHIDDREGGNIIDIS